MKRLNLFFTTLVIGSLSLNLVVKNALAIMVNNHQEQNNHKIQYLLSQNASQQKIINTINSLTPNQRQQIQSIFQSSQPEIDQKTEQLSEAVESLEQSLTPNTPSSTISAAHQEIVSIIDQRNQLYFERLLAIRNLLTVQQRSQLNQAMQSIDIPNPSNSVDIEVLVSPSNIVSLTATQQQEIASIIKTFQPQIEAKNSQLETDLEALGESLKPNTPPATITKAHNQVLTTAIARNQLYFDLLLKIRDILTVSQRSQLNEAIKALISD